jgi:hypothetical protein
MQVLEDDGPFFDIRVDAVSFDGVRELATRTVQPTGWPSAEHGRELHPVLGPNNVLYVSAERGGNEYRTLFYDLTRPDEPPFEMDGRWPAPNFGPTGLVSWHGHDDRKIDVLEPGTGIMRTLRPPREITVTWNWTVDGRGWPARQRVANGAPVDGLYTITGSFERNPVPMSEIWDRDGGRRRGATGGVLTIGGEHSNIMVFEQIGDGGRVWLETPEPGEEVRFTWPEWDAAGEGLWVAMGATDGERRWLAHMPAPEKWEPVMDLPPGPWWSVRQISADDRWMVLSSDAREIAIVDRAAGRVEIVSSADPAAKIGPLVEGWLR